MGNRRLDALRVTYRTKTAIIGRNLAQQELTLHARPELSRLQRRSMTDRLRAQAHQRLQDLAATYEREQNHVIEGLRRQVYRLPPSATRELSWQLAWASVRDMVDELADDDDHQAVHREALQMMDVACTVDDRYMQRALLMMAERRGWTDIASAYATENPDAGEIMGELDDITAELADSETTMADAAMFRVPPPTPPPAEPSLAVALDAQASQWSGNGAVMAQGDDGE